MPIDARGRRARLRTTGAVALVLVFGAACGQDRGAEETTNETTGETVSEVTVEDSPQLEAAVDD